MKKFLFLLVCIMPHALIMAQSNDRQKVERACFDYLEGFYEGDTLKLMRCLNPTLYKFGHWRSMDGQYAAEGQMTFREAIDYAADINAKKYFAKANAPKKVEVFDVMDKTAAAKVTAWWGWDYVLLAKRDDQWMIEQVLWQGPRSRK